MDQKRQVAQLPGVPVTLSLNLPRVSKPHLLLYVATDSEVFLLLSLMPYQGTFFPLPLCHLVSISFLELNTAQSAILFFCGCYEFSLPETRFDEKSQGHVQKSIQNFVY